MENELSKEVIELFNNNVFMTKKNEDIKEFLLMIIEERERYKEIVKNTPNDMDLGRLMRNHLTIKY